VADPEPTAVFSYPIPDHSLLATSIATETGGSPVYNEGESYVPIATMTQLYQQQCAPCQSGSSPITREEIATLQREIPDWDVLEYEGIPRLQKVYKFPNFQQAIAFTNAVGEAAEKEGHHPALLTEWGKVTVSWWTHDLGGLHRNDFIMAARTDAIYPKK
jgi:4a-hydroxytetrahydrobiopterin dehydratase